MIQIRRGDESAARQALLQSLKLDPGHSATHYYLAKIYFAAREFTAAIDEFEAAIKLGDPSGAGHYGLGLALLAESKYVEAIPHLEAAVQGKPQDPQRLFTLVGAELQLKQVDKARSHIIKIRERFERDPALAYQIGKLLLEYNLPEDAEAELERASGLLAQAGNSPGSAALNVSDLHLQMARLHFNHYDYLGTLHEFEKITVAAVPEDRTPSQFPDHRSGFARL